MKFSIRTGSIIGINCYFINSINKIQLTNSI